MVGGEVKNGVEGGGGLIMIRIARPAALPDGRTDARTGCMYARCFLGNMEWRGRMWVSA